MEIELSSLRILIVDDDPAITKLIRMLLIDFGVTQVTIAKTGAEAQQILSYRADEIDIIICDWNMPEVTGLDLLKWVRTSDSEIPFIFLTSRRDLESVKTARAHGVTDYLLKPFKSGQLHRKLVLHGGKVLTA